MENMEFWNFVFSLISLPPFLFVVVNLFVYAYKAYKDENISRFAKWVAFTPVFMAIAITLYFLYVMKFVRLGGEGAWGAVLIMMVGVIVLIPGSLLFVVGLYINELFKLKQKIFEEKYWQPIPPTK